MIKKEKRSEKLFGIISHIYILKKQQINIFFEKAPVGGFFIIK
jgi:hypothetical protein